MKARMLRYAVVLAGLLGARETLALNRIGDADNNGDVDITDAALIQARLLGLVDENAISPLALVDGDTVLGISDMMRVGQTARYCNFLNQPGDWLSLPSTTPLSVDSGNPDFSLSWSVLALPGAAQNTDGLDAQITLSPLGAESGFFPTQPEVLSDLAATIC